MRFAKAMWLMRRGDRQAQEDGFAALRPVAAAHLDALVEAFAQETDHGLQCWLLELIGHARCDGMVPLLERQLYGPRQDLRDNAAFGLELLDSKDARRALWTWRYGRHAPWTSAGGRAAEGR